MDNNEHGTNLAEVGTDCISRQALLDKFEPWLKVKDYNDGELNMLKAILYEIRFMPSAQPKMGRWERHYSRPNVYADLCWHCSECGYRSSDNWAYKFNFCPHCGAKMEGEDE